MEMLAAGKQVNMAWVIIAGGGTIGWIQWGISIVTLALIIQYFISIRRVNIIPEEILAQIRVMFENRQYREAIELTATEPSFLSYTVHAAMSKATHGYAAMERAAEEAVDERMAHLLRKVEWLNLIGNIMPMLGLLGTVWGMILAFFDIVKKGGTPDPGDLAGSIAIALVTTLEGLVVAIPALGVYAILRTRVDELSTEALRTAQGLIGVFHPGAAKKPGTDKPQEKGS